MILITLVHKITTFFSSMDKFLRAHDLLVSEGGMKMYFLSLEAARAKRG